MFNKVNDEQECGFFSEHCSMFGAGGASMPVPFPDPEPTPIIQTLNCRFNLMLFNRR